MKPPTAAKAKAKAKAIDKPSRSRTSTDMTFKASFDDLRRPDHKQLLRQHFTGAFPETQSRPSQDSLNSSDMGPKKRLSRSTSDMSASENSMEKSSSSTSVNSVGEKRLPALPEGDSRIDIEKAINLLQELKKTATPAELVALHKALLPTRDSVILPLSPTLHFQPDQEGSPGSTSSFFRRRSLLPPGVATRGGPSEDLLRTQEEAQASGKLKKAKSYFQSSSKSRLAALDLADDTTQGVHARAPTPSDNEVVHIGGYRPGTLRITNGAASPDPSLLLRVGEDVDDSKLSDDYRTAPTTPEERPRQCDARTPGSKEPSRSRAPRRQSSPSDMQTPPLPESHTNIPTKPWSRAPVPDGSEIPVPLVGDSSQSQLPLDTEGTSSTPRMDRKVSEQSFAVSAISKPSTEPLRPEIDDGRVSPIIPEAPRPDEVQRASDLPRFAQRWSHRLSHISQESETDDQLPPSPHDESTALRNLSKRLSTVQSKGGEGDHTPPVEDAEVALAKLTGSPVQLKKLDTLSKELCKSPVSSPQQYNSPQERSFATKGDSGYGSDDSYHTKQHKIYREAARRKKANKVDETASFDDDGVSLYSLGAMLKGPYLLGGNTTTLPRTAPLPPPARGGKKHLSLLGLTKLKRSNSIAAESSNDTSEKSASMDISPITPSELNNIKPKKKLQKSVPATVRKELKAYKKKLEDEKRTKELGLGTPGSDNTFTSSSRADSEVSSTPTTRPSTEARSIELPADVPVELDGAGIRAEESSNTVPVLPLSETASKSRGRDRKRSRTFDETSQGNSGTLQRSWSFTLRNRSRKRSGSTTPKASTNDLTPKSSMNCFAEISGEQQSIGSSRPANEPAMLISSPYDQSANLLVRQLSAVPTAHLNPSQPQPLNGQRLSRSKFGGLQGMEAGMASEVARLRSRDVAIQKNENLFDRPRMATPRSSSGDKPKLQGSSNSPIATERAYPDSPRGSAVMAVSPKGFDYAHRPPSPYEESIPPLPEMPANVEARVSRMDGKVSKRIRDSIIPTSPRDISEGQADSTASIADAAKAGPTPLPSRPTLSVLGTSADSNMSIADAIRAHSNTAPLVKRPDKDERLGDAHESVADAVKRAMEVREARVARQSRPNRPRKPKPKSKPKTMEKASELQPAELQGPEDDNVVDVGFTIDHEESSTGSSGDETEYVGWAKEAKMWRARRKSLGENLKRSAEENKRPLAEEKEAPGGETESAAVVVSPYTPDISKKGSRYDRRRSSAEQHALAYRDLIAEDKENRPAQDDGSRTDSADTYFTVQTHKEPEDDEQIGSAFSPKPYQTGASPVERARSAGGRVLTPFGPFHPYSPTDPEQADLARADSLAKLTGSAAENEPRKQPDVAKRPGHRPTASLASVVDRYGGGLQYGYEKGLGVGGSAGTRAGADKTQRKSVQLSEAYGVDLSDVPVMLRKV